MYPDQGWAITHDGVRRILRYVTVNYDFHRYLGISGGIYGNFHADV